MTALESKAGGWGVEGNMGTWQPVWGLGGGGKGLCFPWEGAVDGR